MYALVDCNNFFVSCERVFDPRLEGRPVVVLSNNDGCAISRSNEAKALGIPMAAPYFKFRDLAREKGVVCLSSNYALYGDMSRRVMSLFVRWTPDVEVYSIDEAFLGLRKSAPEYLSATARDVHATVKKWTGIPVSVGIAGTKTLAKAANETAKREKMGVCILAERDVPDCLAALKVENVWGIGRNLSEWLRERGLHRALDLRDADPRWIRRQLGVAVERTVLELRGTPCVPLQCRPTDQKALVHARSFGRRIESREEIRSAVAAYAELAAAKLRREGLAARGIRVYVSTDRHRDQEPQYHGSAGLTFPVATHFTPEILDYALKAFGEAFRSGFKYKKAGVMLLDLIPQHAAQGELFDAVDREKARRLMSALDGVQSRHGERALHFAAGNTADGWKPLKQNRTPRYTTHWSELPVARC